MLTAKAARKVELELAALYRQRESEVDALYVQEAHAFISLQETQQRIRLLEEIANDVPIGARGGDGDDFPPINDGHLQAIVMSKLGGIGLTMHDLRNFLADSCGHSREQARERVLHYVNTGEFNLA